MGRAYRMADSDPSLSHGIHTFVQFPPMLDRANLCNQQDAEEISEFGDEVLRYLGFCLTL